MSLWLRNAARRCSIAVATMAVAALPVRAQQPAPPSYFEFGTVVALGRKTVDIQTFNPQLQRVVQHSFELTREARVDLVHVGDSVEIVYAPTSPQWTLRRLVVLAEGIPMAGPPREAAAVPALAANPSDRSSFNRPSSNRPSSDAEPVPAQPAPVASAASLTQPLKPPPPATVKPAKSAKVSSGKSSASRTTNAAVTTPAAVTGAKTAPPAVVAVAGGVPVTAIVPKPPSSKDFAVTAPSDGCRRADPDWPTEPMRIAVIDFRYPTEREEAHDISQVGGGSGTAVADLVFNRLSQASPVDIAFSRGDRRRLDKTDFAGAARLGRQLGVDAVLAGTFFPVETQAVNQYNEPATVKTYELRAGLVDTCTGALLYRLSSVLCATGLEPGIDPGTQTPGAKSDCKHLAVSAAAAANPKSDPVAFQPLLDDLLYPLEHGGKPPAPPASEGIVTEAKGRTITVQLAARGNVHSGDQLSLHTWRLAKNPSTYTLQNMQDNEIGRLTVQSVRGNTVIGTYEGDIAPQPGDTAEPSTP